MVNAMGIVIRLLARGPSPVGSRQHSLPGAAEIAEGCRRERRHAADSRFSRREPVSTRPENAILDWHYIGWHSLERYAMVPFFVQFKCKLGQSYTVANALAEAEIASEIYSTAGDYDLLAKFYVENDTDIGHFVNEKVQVIPGIQDTHTIITFKAFGSK
jgi:DNA-binding Lrp family transcriptional regulator